MNPSDLQPKTELAYGTGITGVSLVINWIAIHWLDAISIATTLGTCIGALCGAVVGLHAVYRLMKPKPRKNRRVTDRE